MSKREYFIFIFLTLIFIASFAVYRFFLLNVSKQQLGGDRDEHGCIGSAGYSWCANKNKCLRAWEEACEPGDVVHTQKMEEARQTLIDYFKALASKDYVTAQKYHGSGYATLTAWNTKIKKTNYTALLRGGCEVNGWACLEISNVVKNVEENENSYIFNSQFAKNDGSTFKLNDQDTFEFTVKDEGQGFKVTTAPVLQ